MWKDFFYYSKSERRAVYVLSVLIVVLVLALLLVPEQQWRPSASDASVDSLKAADFTALQKSEPTPSVIKKKPATVLAAFDPNQADSIEFQRLGLPAYVVRNIIKYREKGGRFTTLESFSRIYGLTEAKFEELKPFIHISESFALKHPVASRKSPKDTVVSIRERLPKDTLIVLKYPEGTLVDVATADTLELKKIPGVGSVIAKMIVAYRNRLGGFYDLKQLEEVKYVTPAMMKWFKLEEVNVRKLEINKAGLDKLRAHPYLNFYQAKVIMEYRRKRGEIKSLSQLSLYEEFTEKDLERLAAYISFD